VSIIVAFIDTRYFEKVKRINKEFNTLIHKKRKGLAFNQSEIT
jgi:hypothetical protein